MSHGCQSFERVDKKQQGDGNTMSDVDFVVQPTF
jgi:hypothetical protein